MFLPFPSAYAELNQLVFLPLSVRLLKIPFYTHAFPAWALPMRERPKYVRLKALFLNLYLRKFQFLLPVLQQMRLPSIDRVCPCQEMVPNIDTNPILLNLPLCYIFPQDIMNANKGKREGNEIIETV